MSGTSGADEIVVIVHDTGLAWVEQTARAARASGCRVGLVTGATSPGELARLGSLVDRVETVGDPTDPGQVADAARRLAEGRRLGAVLSGNDGCVASAAAAAEALGVGRAPARAVALARNKYAAREALRRAGLPVPRFALLTEQADTAEVAAAVGFPAIVKPVNGTGSHLVLRVGSPAELAEAYRTLAERLPEAETGRLYAAPLPGAEGEGPGIDPRRAFLVEGLLRGREYCVDLVIRDGEIEQLPLIDKPLIDGHFFELGFSTPPFDLPAEREARIRAAVGAAVRAIGLDNTVAHVEVIDDERLGPTIVEINAARGGGMCSHTLYRLTTGIDTAAELVAVCRSARAPRGAPVLPTPLACLSIFAEAPGRLRAVHGLERLEEHPDVMQVVQVRGAGDVVSAERETPVLLIVAAGFFDADDLAATYAELKGMVRLEFEPPGAPAGHEPTESRRPCRAGHPTTRKDRRMTHSAPVITVRGLRRSYGRVQAVDGLDLDVYAGEVFALLGPNGAGKTTTIEILEGYRRRDAGEVRVLGEDPARAGAAWRARVGVVLQEATDAGLLTVEETVRHFAGYYPRPRDPAEVMELVGLTEKRGSRVRRLSGGQRRRLDVALGILGRPALVFMDEPTTGFDPEARRRFWQVIRSLSEEGTTVLLTTHYLDEAEALADRAAVIASGRLVAVGKPSELNNRNLAETVVRWQDNGAVRAQRTSTPTALIVQLAQQLGGEVPGLSVHRPSLEDVYLDLVGHVAEPADEPEEAAVALATSEQGQPA